MSRSAPNLLQALEKHLDEGGRYALAVSGGVDSVTLLDACVRLQDALKLRLEVAHLDHGFREKSAEEARFVRGLAETYGLIFHEQRAEPLEVGQNKEAYGRAERYRFFAEVLDTANLDYTLTAHHADDVAETLLMRLVANKELGSIALRDEERKVIRPFLSIPKSAIVEYAEHHRLDYVEDESNADTRYLRNRVRHVLLPHLAAHFDERIGETLAERAEGLADDHSELTRQAALLVRNIKGDFGSRPWLNEVRDLLKNSPPALSWRIAEQLFLPFCGYPLGRRKGKEVVDFLLSGRVALQIPGGFELRRKDGGLHCQLLEGEHS